MCKKLCALNSLSQPYTANIAIAHTKLLFLDTKITVSTPGREVRKVFIEYLFVYHIYLKYA